MYKLRPYQQQAVDSAKRYYADKHQKKPVLMVEPTGCGKSLIIAEIANQVDAPLLVFQPTKEILQQNYNKMCEYNIFGVTIYSASMNQKNIGNITLATIGSVYKKPQDFKHFKYVLVDEGDLVNAKGGIYKGFLETVGEKIIGLTATPYRLSHDGYGGSIMKFLTRTNPRIYSRVIHVTQTKELLAQGYLAKTDYFPINGFTRAAIKLNSTGADYDEPSERQYYDKTSFDKKIIKVVKRLLEIGKTRILVFTKFVHEAQSLADELGSVASVVHGEMNAKERDAVIKGFRSGQIKVVTNCAVLTAGFDYPELEVVVVARPTRSLRLWYQMTGRVVRPDLTDLTKTKMVVDMCANYEIYGGIADMEIVERGGDNLWAVMSRGKQLTNKYLDEIMRD
jgi:DNA repair protein RadD